MQSFFNYEQYRNIFLFNFYYKPFFFYCYDSYGTSYIAFCNYMSFILILKYFKAKYFSPTALQPFVFKNYY